ncbi:MAG: LuxR C-terminal-related transcriptional regulator, partial [Pseudomonadales bacterium]|nr:LuxR C-terminal-related transcriptional regulator [Pseudomonadales bacterium]
HPEIIRTFNLFLDHLPSALRVVVTARSEPQLNLARRRAQRQLVEFNQSQLAFSVDDTLRFFEDSFGETFARADIEFVVAKTEGWPTAIQLLALSLARNVRDLNLAGASKVLASCVSDALHKDIADYLFDEVFSMLAPELQGFLVKTACPSRFCASLANELTERFDGFDIIKNIDQSNLFLVPLDNHRTWYRYHDSFRQFLLQRFDSLPKDEQQKVQETAGSWLENGGYLNIEIYDSFKGASMHTPPESTDLIELPELEPLTKRERQVMAYLKEGLSNKEIAAHLHISLNTLKVHIRNLYGKIGVENRTQALVKMKGLHNS